jgi:hypothetical protein
MRKKDHAAAGVQRQYSLRRTKWKNPRRLKHGEDFP